MKRHPVQRRQRGPEDHVEGMNRVTAIVNGATRRQRVRGHTVARRGEPGERRRVAQAREVLDLIDPAQAAKPVLERERREHEVNPGTELPFPQPRQRGSGRERSIAVRPDEAIALGVEGIERPPRVPRRRENGIRGRPPSTLCRVVASNRTRWSG